MSKSPPGKASFLDARADEEIPLPVRGGLPAAVHVFDEHTVLAVNAALAARRPLLIRGDPGTGKSQLGRAVAEKMKWAFVWKVIDARTEAQDLLYAFDAIARLAEAQLMGAAGRSGSLEDPEVGRSRLDERRFVAPGPLWWAFDWRSAVEQAREARALVPEPPPGWEPGDGSVVLLDEIDKADSSVPNGLLEALGSVAFPVPGRAPVTAGGRAPLVVVTTNEERVLPDAFLRRCMVLQLALPEDRSALIAGLMQRGASHFPACAEGVRRKAAELLADDRKAVRASGLSPPGQAEYLDLLRAVTEQTATEAEQLGLLQRIAVFALRKHPPEVER